MTVSDRHKGHDQLLAQVELTQRRLADLTEKLETYSDEVRQAFTDQIEALDERCQNLITRVSSWTEVELGISTSVADLASAVDAIEADLAARIESIGPRYELAMDRQMRTWRTRLDSLGLQGALGAMEAREDLEGLSHRVEAARIGVLMELQNALGDSKDVVVDLRNDVEEVLVDVRHAVERAVAALAGK
jgi:hypothetical protein